MSSSQELISELTDQSYYLHLDDGLEGNEIVNYSIFSYDSLEEGYGAELIIGGNEVVIYAHNHENPHEIFIRSVFERLDALLDLDFIEADTSGNSNINIHRSWYNSYYEEIDGLDNDPSPSPDAGTGGGTAHFDYDHIDISWKDYYADDPFTDAEKLTIVHEIGHAIGLDDLAYDPRWDTYDSIMSYNHPATLPFQTWFTDADIAAMQTIWGIEDDDVINDVDGNGFVDGITNYQIWTALGGVDLTNRRGRTYSDDSSRMWDAIKAVETNSGFSVLVEGQRNKEGKFKVATANDEGVVGGTSRWFNGNQMFNEGYEDLFAMDFNGNNQIGF